MGTETFAEVASVLCPGFEVEAIEHAGVPPAVQVLPHAARDVAPVRVGSAGGNGDVLVSVVLKSIVQPKPELPVQVRMHFRGRVRDDAHAPRSSRR